VRKTTPLPIFDEESRDLQRRGSHKTGDQEATCERFNESAWQRFT
jgi:hypothetical protein